MAWPTETEVCDGLDNDCDGQTDEDEVGQDPLCVAGQACQSGLCLPEDMVLVPQEAVGPLPGGLGEGEARDIEIFRRASVSVVNITSVALRRARPARFPARD